MYETREKIKIRGRKNNAFPQGKTQYEKEFYKYYGVWGTSKQVLDFAKWKHRERAIDKSEKDV